MTLTYKDLTDQDAINLLKYEYGLYALLYVANEYFASKQNHPESSPRSCDLLLSYLLQVDFRADIYEAIENNKDRWNVPGKTGFIGDDLTGILWNEVSKLTKSTEVIIDAALLNKIRKELVALWTEYKRAYKLEEFAEPTTASCQYVPAGVILDGQMLYKRVEKKED